MYLSRKTSIDFVAHHEIQFQSCRGVYEELSKIHECRALIGQDIKPTGANVAVLMDHSCFQPRVNKKNYKYLIHMSHDLADWDIYFAEKKVLSKFDLIMVPGFIHYEKAIKSLSAVKVFKIGWPKLELVDNAGNLLADHCDIDRINIIYAPSFIDNREWVQLLPELIKTGHNIIIKNHIYYDFESGVAPPKGGEEIYKKAIDSLLEMEEFLSQTKATNVVYIDRRSNLCTLFPRAHVLITDSSSASLEFLSFGLSIETGRYGEKNDETKPYNSLITEQVKYIPVHELVQLLKNKNYLDVLINGGIRDANEIVNPFIYSPPNGPSKYAASVIDLFLYLKQNNGRIYFNGNNSIPGKVRKWLSYILE